MEEIRVTSDNNGRRSPLNAADSGTISKSVHVNAHSQSKRLLQPTPPETQEQRVFVTIVSELKLKVGYFIHIKAALHGYLH